MSKTFVIAPGHCWTPTQKIDPGVIVPSYVRDFPYTINYRIYEGDVMFHFVSDLARKLAQIKMPYILVVGDLKTKVKMINRIMPLFAVEFHLNADPWAKGKGHEVLRSRSKKSTLLAQIIDKHLDATPLPDRNVKVGYFRGNPLKKLLYFLRATKVPAAIVELCFITRVECQQYLRDHWNTLIEIVAAALVEVYKTFA